MKNYDLIVVGGGLTGVAAAVSAAREGMNVLLIEKGNALGGAPVNGLVLPYMPNSTVIDGKEFMLSQGFFTEINERLLKYPNAYDGGLVFNEEYLKIVLYELVEEAGVELLYHALLIGADCKNNKVNKISLATKLGVMELSAKYFIDTTGDADLAYHCGFPYRLGREEDNLCQPMTLCFRLANVDIQKAKENGKKINETFDEYKKLGKITNPRENVLKFYPLIEGVIHFNTTRVIKRNPTDPFDVTKAEIEARKQVLELVEMLKDNIEGFENCRLLSTASEIGVRESRMIDGEYILTGEDIISCYKFEDSISLGNYDIDIHNPSGTGTSHYYFKPGEYYTIPYRSLVPKNSENLLVAGRCISVDHRAQASIRIMPIVTTLGQAAGLAVAIANKENASVKNIDIKLLQEKIKLNKGVF